MARQVAAAADVGPARAEVRDDEARQQALARSLGIDLAQVAADGVIRERDVLRHHQARAPGQARGSEAITPIIQIPQAGRLDPQFLSFVRAVRNASPSSSRNSNCSLPEVRRPDRRGRGSGPRVLDPRRVCRDRERGPFSKTGASSNAARRALARSGAFAGFDCHCRHLEIGAEAFFARHVVVGRGGSDEPTAVLKVGDRTFVGENVLLNTGMPIAIGDECFIGQGSAIMTHTGHYLEGFDNAFAAVASATADRGQLFRLSGRGDRGRGDRDLQQRRDPARARRQAGRGRAGQGGARCAQGHLGARAAPSVRDLAGALQGSLGCARYRGWKRKTNRGARSAFAMMGRSSG